MLHQLVTIAYAAVPDSLGSGSNSTFAGVVGLVIARILNPLVALIVGLGLVTFLWGVLKYVGKADDEGEREKAKQLMTYGLIALFVMVSVWGLVNVLSATFNFGSTDVPIPTFGS